MQIPQQFKQAWFGLATVALIIVIIVLIILGSKMSRASFGQGNFPATITINGKGEVNAVPDISRFTITIEETAADQKTALAQSSVKSNAVIDALQKAGIDEKDIKTIARNDYPKYEYTRGAVEIAIYPPIPAKQTITGYVSTHTLSVKVRDLDLVTTVQQIFADQKVTNVSGPELSIDDTEIIKVQARELAIMDAKEQAQVLADQLGVRLGKIVSFSESDGGMYPMYRMEAMSADMAGAPKSSQPTIAAGEQTITSQVSVTYRLK